MMTTTWCADVVTMTWRISSSSVKSANGVSYAWDESTMGYREPSTRKFVKCKWCSNFVDGTYEQAMRWSKSVRRCIHGSAITLVGCMKMWEFSLGCWKMVKTVPTVRLEWSVLVDAFIWHARRVPLTFVMSVDKKSFIRSMALIIVGRNRKCLSSFSSSSIEDKEAAKPCSPVKP